MTTAVMAVMDSEGRRKGEATFVRFVSEYSLYLSLASGNSVRRWVDVTGCSVRDLYDILDLCF